MASMKALVKVSPEHAEIKQIPIPSCGPGEVLIRVKSAALCGTDLHILEWNRWAQNAGIKLPFVVGHECCGDIVALGEGVRGLAAGDKIAVETHVPCGTCHQCLIGEQHICNNLALFGVHMNGCFAEYAVVPAVCARKIPLAIDYDLGSMMEPIGTAFRSVMETGVGGASVLVTGCGPIGLFAVAAADILGASLIVASDISQSRLEIARRLGANQMINPQQGDMVERVRALTNGYGVDVIIEASGNAKALADSFKLLRKGGKVALVGLPGQPVELEIGRDIVFKEAKVIGIHGRKMFSTWSQIERLMTSGKLDIGAVMTHSFPLAEWQEGVRLAKSGEACKVILHP